MTQPTPPYPSQDLLSRFLLAWGSTAIIDGLFSTVLSVAFYNSTFSRLFQGVAGTIISSASEGGARTTAIGVLMHCCVAGIWSALFIFGLMRFGFIRRLQTSWSGIVGVAAIYGPFIWLFMSLVVISLSIHRLIPMNYRWWIQLIGHFPFVGLPIVASASHGMLVTDSAPSRAPAT